eukprot:gene7063-6699_t
MSEVAKEARIVRVRVRKLEHICVMCGVDPSPDKADEEDE